VRRLVLISIAAAVMSTSATVDLASGSAPHGQLERCGDIADEGAGVYDVEARHVSCENARRVARQWEDDCEAPGCEILGFRCNERLLGYERVRINCRRAPRLVRFIFGS
jgi:hypothetical protein